MRISSPPSSPPIDPHLRRWMLFVDGENLTIRAQNLAHAKGITLKEGEYYYPDVFVWMPRVEATEDLYAHGHLQVQAHAIRSYYYTSAMGDEALLNSIRKSVRELGFHPEVFKKSKKEEKAKGVDIALTKDLLSHAFLHNYDVVVLIAGDGDYIPLINEVKRLGKVVYVAFFSDSGLNPDLHLASDRFFDMSDTFLDNWRWLLGQPELRR